MQALHVRLCGPGASAAGRAVPDAGTVRDLLLHERGCDMVLPDRRWHGRLYVHDVLMHIYSPRTWSLRAYVG